MIDFFFAMLSSMQVSYCQPRVAISSVPRFQPPRKGCGPRVAFLPVPRLQLPPKGFRLVTNGAYGRRCSPVCFSGGKGKSQNSNDSSPWKGLERFMGDLKKELTAQDVLRDQKQALEFNDGGGGYGGFGNRPGGGGGDGSGNRFGGRGGNGFDSSEDGFILGIVDELVQIILATIGLVCVYIYILNGEELTRLAKDYIRYLTGAKKSRRLKKSMVFCERLKKRLTTKKKDEEEGLENWLEFLLLSTPTSWYYPHELNRVASKLLSDSGWEIESDSYDEIPSEIPSLRDKPGQEKPTGSEATTDSKVKDDSDKPGDLDTETMPIIAPPFEEIKRVVEEAAKSLEPIEYDEEYLKRIYRLDIDDSVESDKEDESDEED